MEGGGTNVARIFGFDENNVASGGGGGGGGGGGENGIEEGSDSLLSVEREWERERERGGERGNGNGNRIDRDMDISSRRGGGRRDEQMEHDDNEETEEERRRRRLRTIGTSIRTRTRPEFGSGSGSGSGFATRNRLGTGLGLEERFRTGGMEEGQDFREFVRLDVSGGNATDTGTGTGTRNGNRNGSSGIRDNREFRDSGAGAGDGNGNGLENRRRESSSTNNNSFQSDHHDDDDDDNNNNTPNHNNVNRLRQFRSSPDFLHSFDLDFSTIGSNHNNDVADADFSTMPYNPFREGYLGSSNGGGASRPALASHSQSRTNRNQSQSQTRESRHPSRGTPSSPPPPPASTHHQRLHNMISNLIDYTDTSDSAPTVADDDDERTTDTGGDGGDLPLHRHLRRDFVTRHSPSPPRRNMASMSQRPAREVRSGGGGSGVGRIGIGSRGIVRTQVVDDDDTEEMDMESRFRRYQQGLQDSRGGHGGRNQNHHYRNRGGRTVGGGGDISNSNRVADRSPPFFRGGGAGVGGGRRNDPRNANNNNHNISSSSNTSPPRRFLLNRGDPGFTEAWVADTTHQGEVYGFRPPSAASSIRTGPSEPGSGSTRSLSMNSTGTTNTDTSGWGSGLDSLTLPNVPFTEGGRTILEEVEEEMAARSSRDGNGIGIGRVGRRNTGSASRSDLGVGRWSLDLTGYGTGSAGTGAESARRNNSHRVGSGHGRNNTFASFGNLTRSPEDAFGAGGASGRQQAVGRHELTRDWLSGDPFSSSSEGGDFEEEEVDTESELERRHRRDLGEDTEDPAVNDTVANRRLTTHRGFAPGLRLAGIHHLTSSHGNTNSDGSNTIAGGGGATEVGPIPPGPSTSTSLSATPFFDAEVDLRDEMVPATPPPTTEVRTPATISGSATPGTTGRMSLAHSRHTSASGHSLSPARLNRATFLGSLEFGEGGARSERSPQRTHQQRDNSGPDTPLFPSMRSDSSSLNSNFNPTTSNHHQPADGPVSWRASASVSRSNLRRRRRTDSSDEGSETSGQQTTSPSRPSSRRRRRTDGESSQGSTTSGLGENSIPASDILTSLRSPPGGGVARVNGGAGQIGRRTYSVSPTSTLTRVSNDLQNGTNNSAQGTNDGGASTSRRIFSHPSFPPLSPTLDSAPVNGSNSFRSNNPFQIPRRQSLAMSVHNSSEAEQLPHTDSPAPMEVDFFSQSPDQTSRDMVIGYEPMSPGDDSDQDMRTEQGQDQGTPTSESRPSTVQLPPVRINSPLRFSPAISGDESQSITPSQDTQALHAESNGQSNESVLNLPISNSPLPMPLEDEVPGAPRPFPTFGAFSNNLSARLSGDRQPELPPPRRQNSRQSQGSNPFETSISPPPRPSNPRPLLDRQGTGSSNNSLPANRYAFGPFSVNSDSRSRASNSPFREERARSRDYPRPFLLGNSHRRIDSDSSAASLRSPAARAHQRRSTLDRIADIPGANGNLLRRRRRDTNNTLSSHDSLTRPDSSSSGSMFSPASREELSESDQIFSNTLHNRWPGVFPEEPLSQHERIRRMGGLVGRNDSLTSSNRSPSSLFTLPTTSDSPFSLPGQPPRPSPIRETSADLELGSLDGDAGLPRWPPVGRTPSSEQGFRPNLARNRTSIGPLETTDNNAARNAGEPDPGPLLGRLPFEENPAGRSSRFTSGQPFRFHSSDSHEDVNTMRQQRHDNDHDDPAQSFGASDTMRTLREIFEESYHNSRRPGHTDLLSGSDTPEVRERRTLNETPWTRMSRELREARSAETRDFPSWREQQDPQRLRVGGGPPRLISPIPDEPGRSRDHDSSSSTTTAARDRQSLHASLNQPPRLPSLADLQRRHGPPFGQSEPSGSPSDANRNGHHQHPLISPEIPTRRPGSLDFGGRMRGPTAAANDRWRGLSLDLRRDRSQQQQPRTPRPPPPFGAIESFEVLTPSSSDQEGLTSGSLRRRRGSSSTTSGGGLGGDMRSPDATFTALEARRERYEELERELREDLAPAPRQPRIRPPSRSIRQQDSSDVGSTEGEENGSRDINGFQASLAAFERDLLDLRSDLQRVPSAGDREGQEEPEADNNDPFNLFASPRAQSPIRLPTTRRPPRGPFESLRQRILADDTTTTTTTTTTSSRRRTRLPPFLRDGGLFGEAEFFQQLIPGGVGGNDIANDPRNYLPDDNFDSSYDALLRLADRIGEVKPRGISSTTLASLKRFKYSEWDSWKPKKNHVDVDPALAPSQTPSSSSSNPAPAPPGSSTVSTTPGGMATGSSVTVEQLTSRGTAATTTISAGGSGNGSGSDSDRDTRCGICLDEYKEDDVLLGLSSCNHALHAGCLESWLQDTAQCPLCRATVS